VQRFIVLFERRSSPSPKWRGMMLAAYYIVHLLSPTTAHAHDQIIRQ
jgi:hypothetical protein